MFLADCNCCGGECQNKCAESWSQVKIRVRLPATSGYAWSNTDYLQTIFYWEQMQGGCGNIYKSFINRPAIDYTFYLSRYEGVDTGLVVDAASRHQVTAYVNTSNQYYPPPGGVCVVQVSAYAQVATLHGDPVPPLHSQCAWAENSQLSASLIWSPGSIAAQTSMTLRRRDNWSGLNFYSSASNVHGPASRSDYINRESVRDAPFFSSCNACGSWPVLSQGAFPAGAALPSVGQEYGTNRYIRPLYVDTNYPYIATGIPRSKCQAIPNPSSPLYGSPYGFVDYELYIRRLADWQLDLEFL